VTTFSATGLNIYIVRGHAGMFTVF